MELISKRYVGALIGRAFALLPVTSRQCAAAILGHKIACAALLLLLPTLFPMLFTQDSITASRLTRSDIGAYLAIATDGYAEDLCAFYPLWPGCIRAGGFLSGGRTLLAAYLLANVLSFGALLLFHRLVEVRHDLQTANRATFLMLLYPGSIFFFFPYSESLFLFLLMTCLLCLHYEILWGTALSALFLPLSRAIGIFILPVLIWEFSRRRAPRKVYAICFAPLLGYMCYFGIIYCYTGNVWQGFTAQEAYPARASVGRIFDVVGFLQAFLDFEWSHSLLHSFIDRFVFLAFLVSLYWILRLDTGYYVYALLAGLVPAMSNIFMSYTRFCSVVFPLFVVWARFCWRTGTEPFWLALFFGVQVLFLLLFVSGSWIG